MEFQVINIEELGASIELSRFHADEVTEFHAMLHIESRGEMFTDQLARLKETEARLKNLETLSGANIVFKRYFLSDATNQVPLINEDDKCTISYIQQPPLDGSKIALWLYLQRGTDITHTADSTIATHNGYRHIWTMGLTDSSVETSYMQTERTLSAYMDILNAYNATLEANCIRTWFFVRDVDTQYSGLVKSRRECFVEQGLTQDTHYIASTGIGGNPADPKAIVQLGCYAITGFQPEQQRYLYALTHLNKTYEYGVTFERGTLMQYGDRNHIYISGTASINNKGEVMHVGDITKQTQRMWENVEKLLEEGGMDICDIMQIIVYLRDGADYDIVRKMFKEKYPTTPIVITLAPVCRPTWLIEMECIAVKKAENEHFRVF